MPFEAAMLLIDHQVGTMAWTHSSDINLVKRNALRLARIAARPDLQREAAESSSTPCNRWHSITGVEGYKPIQLKRIFTAMRASGRQNLRPCKFMQVSPDRQQSNYGIGVRSTDPGNVSCFAD
jgi:hypothetical protein